MRPTQWVIGLVVIVVGGYFIGGGLVWVATVRADEARLQRAIATVTLPDVQLVQRPTRLATRDIWFGWLVAHVPVLDLWDSRPWRPGQPVSVRAVYRTTVPAAAVHAQYRARFDPTYDLALASNGYYLLVPADTVDLNITIEPGLLRPSGDLVPTSTPQIAAPDQQLRPNPESGSPQAPPQAARVEIWATFRHPASGASPTP